MSQLSSHSPCDKHRLRVLLANESVTVRQALRSELQEATWLETIGEVDNSHYLMSQLFVLRPDAVILSTCLKGDGGFEGLRSIKRIFADCVVILTSRQPDYFIKEAGRLLGATAVCCVSERPTQLLAHLRRSIGQQSGGA